MSLAFQQTTGDADVLTPNGLVLQPACPNSRLSFSLGYNLDLNRYRLVAPPGQVLQARKKARQRSGGKMHTKVKCFFSHSLKLGASAMGPGPCKTDKGLNQTTDSPGLALAGQVDRKALHWRRCCCRAQEDRDYSRRPSPFFQACVLHKTLHLFTMQIFTESHHLRQSPQTGSGC